MLHSPTPRNTPSHNTLDAFDRGDYLTAARQLSPDCWQHWASRAALGATANVTDALVGFDDPGAQFFAGVAAWMERDDERAIALFMQALALDPSLVAAREGLVESTVKLPSR